MKPSLENPVHRAHALLVYAESIAAGKRVVVFGDASQGFGARLIALGARLVHVYDPKPARVRTALESAGTRAVTLSEMPDGDLDVRPGAFDLAIVPDIASFPDAPALLARLRKVLASEGALLVAARNADSEEEPEAGDVAGSLNYYDLYDLVSLQFSHVRMIAQVSFTGVVMAELGEANTGAEVSVDTTLASNEPPTSFIALAAQTDVALEPYAIIQLPAPLLAVRAEPPRDWANERDVYAAEQARTREELERATALTSANGRRAEAELQSRDEQLKQAEKRAADHYVRAESLRDQVRTLEEELQRQKDRATRLTKEVEDEKRVRTRAEFDLGVVQKADETTQLRKRVVALEEALRNAQDESLVLRKSVVDAEAALTLRARESEEFSTKLQTAVAAQETAADGARIELESLRARVRFLEGESAQFAQSFEGDLIATEAKLQERGKVVQDLEAEVARRDRIIHELLATLEEVEIFEAVAPALKSEGDADGLSALTLENAAFRAKLDALAMELARREGESHASEWEIAELTEKLSLAQSEGSEMDAAALAKLAELEQAFVATQNELDALRKALDREHEARRKAEQGEALAKSQVLTASHNDG